MAEFQAEISATGATVAAISVDTTAESERLRTQLSLPFPMLCDVERHVIREWDRLNARERGGIAKPAVFVILQADPNPVPIRRKTYLPLPGDWIRAIRINLRRP